MHDNFSYDLVERLSFLRYGGTDDELRAANILLDEIKKLGGEGHLEEFRIPACELKKYSAKVIAPYEKELEVMAYGCSGTLPLGGVDLKLYYAERGLAEDYLGMDDLSDTAVIINELNYDAYKLLCQKKAAAFITISNKHWDDNNTNDLIYRPLRKNFTDNGKIPGFMIWASDATDLVRDGASMIHLELEAAEMERTSRNVVATIPGTEITNESVVITAHYDSVMIGTGAWDNATGSATIMYIYRHFLQHRPRRTLHFVWCGTEEQGLLGSKAWVAAHEDELDKHVLMINCDVAAPTLGHNIAHVLADEKVVGYVDAMMREMGSACDVKLDIYSSDCIPFADKGVPAVNFCRFGAPGANYIHDRRDNLKSDYIDEHALDITLQQIFTFTKRVVAAECFPIERKVCEEIIKKVDEYLFKEKKDK